MPVPEHLRSFWFEFARDTGSANDARFYEAFRFGDSEDMANELADLVVRGIKRATASSLWSVEAEGKPLPKPGALSIVTNWMGNPLCVIETESVAVLPFGEVTADFAAREGEGDGSLAYWRSVHRQFFARECATFGREFNDSMLVACECFSLVYATPRSAA